MIFKKSKSSGAFTLVEILMSLAILAVLLASVATAFHASVMNYRENEDMFRAMNTARQALLRITTTIRTAQAVAKIGIEAGDDADNQRCSLITADDKDITYMYNAGDNILYLVTNYDLTDSDYVLCRNVTAVSFDRATVPDNPAAIRNVRISMTVSIGNVSQTICTAAVVRKNL